MSPRRNTRQNIIDAAKILFRERGYNETHVSEIAAAANISPAVIYKHFLGKRDLFEALDMPDAEDYRPTQEKRRRDIITHALTVFGERGYQGTTMESIAKKAGYSKAGLYQYFSSKNELFLAVLSETQFKLDLEKDNISDCAQDLESDILRIGNAYMKMLAQPERVSFTRMLFYEARKYPEIADVYDKHGFGYVAQNVYQCIKNHVKVDAKDERLLWMASRSYVASLLSFSVLRNVMGLNRDGTEIKEVVTVSTTILLQGIMSQL